MTALAANFQREKRGIGRVFAVPVAATTRIYKGGLVGIDGDGFAIPASDTASQKVIGVAIEEVNNTGADGALNVRVDADCEFRFVATSITQAMLGTMMYVVDDNTVDDAAGPTNDAPVGPMTQFISTTACWVYVPGLTVGTLVDVS